MRRFENPSEIITAALFLASPMSGYVTGEDVVVAGLDLRLVMRVITYAADYQGRLSPIAAMALKGS